MPKHETKHISLNNLGYTLSLVMKFGQFMLYYKIKFFIKIFYEKCDLDTSCSPFLIFKESSVKKESEEASMMIWTNFDSFAIKYVISRLLQISDFPIQVTLNSLEKQKGLELVFRMHFL